MQEAAVRLWKRIEALLRHHATGAETSALEVQAAIAEQMTTILESEEDTFRSLGVLSSAFLFQEGADDYWSLFEGDSHQGSRDHQSSNVFASITGLHSPYIVRPDPLDRFDETSVKALIHGLFRDVRKLQETAVRSSAAEPEFFRWLPGSGRDSPFLFENDFRTSFGVHYVSVGETQVAFLAWRALQTLIMQGGGNQSLEALVHMSPLTPVAPQPIRWLDLPIPTMEEPYDPQTEALIPKLSAKIDAFGTWSGEIEYWLRDSSNWEAFSTFAAKIPGVGWTISRDPAVVGRICMSYISALFGSGAKTIGQALSEMERGSRFPMPAYFYWHLSENRARAHLVAPIWTSALNPKKHKAGPDQEARSQSSVGLALVSVEPMSEMEPRGQTAGSENECNVEYLDDGRSEAVPVTLQTIDLLNLLRQIARPLVEFVFYEPVKWREAAAQANQLVAAIMSRNLSHNIGSHVLYHLREELYEQTGSVEKDPVKTQVSDLIKYLQARMDFIALVSSGGTTWPGCVTLAQLERPLGYNSLLLEHIISSQRTRPPKILFRLDPPSGDEDNDPDEIKAHTDFSIPAGVVGAHAVYAIIENFTRNSAKYGRGLKDEELRVQLSIRESDPEQGLYECVLSDNNRSPLAGAKVVQDSFSGPLYDYRNLDRSYRHWGLKEIKIAALFLVGGVAAVRSELRGQYDTRQTPLQELEPNWEIIPLEEPAGKPNGDAREELCSLQLRFFLQKPLGICLVGSEIHKSGAVFDKTGDLLLTKVSPKEALSFRENEKYEMMVLDQQAFRQVKSEGRLDRVADRAKRLAYVGADIEPPAELHALGAVKLASSWRELADAAGATVAEPWKAIGMLWVDRKWPGRIIRGVDTSRYRELNNLLDPSDKRTYEVFENEVNGLTDTEAKRLLVWDHTSYGDNRPYLRVGFHCSVSTPFSMPVSARDGIWHLKEAACIRVAIIDERIHGRTTMLAKRVGKFRHEDCQVGPVWRRAGVAILDEKTLDAWHPDRQPDSEHPLLVELRKFGDEPGRRWDMLVVHRGLVDKRVADGTYQLPAGSSTDPLSSITQELISWLEAATDRLVLNSGRGLEPAYRDFVGRRSVGFIETSALTDAVMDNPGDKVGLVRLLRSV